MPCVTHLQDDLCQKVQEAGKPLQVVHCSVVLVNDSSPLGLDLRKQGGRGEVRHITLL
jgi:hypothetical protein